MAPYQFFLIFVVMLVAGVAVVTLNQATSTPDTTLPLIVVESLPEMPDTTVAAPDSVLL